MHLLLIYALSNPSHVSIDYARKLCLSTFLTCIIVFSYASSNQDHFCVDEINSKFIFICIKYFKIRQCSFLLLLLLCQRNGYIECTTELMYRCTLDGRNAKRWRYPSSRISAAPGRHTDV